MYNEELLMTDKEFEKAYARIKNNITEGITVVDSPVAVVLGGQPGAGKSNKSRPPLQVVV